MTSRNFDEIKVEKHLGKNGERKQRSLIFDTPDIYGILIGATGKIFAASHTLEEIDTGGMSLEFLLSSLLFLIANKRIHKIYLDLSIVQDELIVETHQQTDIILNKLALGFSCSSFSVNLISRHGL